MLQNQVPTRHLQDLLNGAVLVLLEQVKLLGVGVGFRDDCCVDRKRPAGLFRDPRALAPEVAQTHVAHPAALSKCLAHVRKGTEIRELRKTIMQNGSDDNGRRQAPAMPDR